MARYAARAGLGTIQSEVLARLQIGIGDLLVWIFDCGWTAGSGQAIPLPDDPNMAALLQTILDRHEEESGRIDTFADLIDPFDDAPAWLRAHAERVEAQNVASLLEVRS